ncbi:uncharacterized protein LOC134689875 [Mytilus trossulus]|uniref:uncharacterized protein LOC134689875 n=1 Tax=Mytilus trossulus TaxID=6551 RepID=UPI003006571C
MQAEAVLNYEFQNYRFQSTYSMMSFYHDNPEHLQKLINEQGHLLDKDGVNILTEQESSVEQEKILVIEPRPKSASTSVGKNCTDQEVPSTSKAAEEENEKYIWDDCSIKRLIEYIKEHSNKFEEGRLTKKAVWEIIAIKFIATSDEQAKTVTWIQLKSKWQKLESKFKQVEDKNKKVVKERITSNTWRKWKKLLGTTPTSVQLRPFPPWI